MEIALLGNGTVAQGVISHIALLQTQNKTTFHVAKVLLRETRELPSPLYTHDFQAILNDKKIKIIVEAIGGIHPAYDYVKAAILAKKHVVSANKNLVSEHGEELDRLAKENKVAFLFSAAVGGGLPILSTLSRVRRVEEITRFEGILNGTTNYILDAMTRRNMPFAEALKKAQEAGYAEADPSGDLQGADLLYKVRVAACVGMNVWIDPRSIAKLSLEFIAKEDIDYFASRERVIRYLVNVSKHDGKFSAYIQPTAVEASEIAALVVDNNNYFSYTGERSRTQILIGQGAGGSVTAANILRDLALIQDGIRWFLDGDAESVVADPTGITMRYYLRMSLDAYHRLNPEYIVQSTPTLSGMRCITALMKVAELCKVIENLQTIDPKVFAVAIKEEAETC
ncbi:MAG TPA: hypothetical protein DCQ90_08940 [Erysipelotrichaceae bacterium]|nr:hypothetical protein [Erysipelotrichaceae bacterium]